MARGKNRFTPQIIQKLTSQKPDGKRVTLRGTQYIAGLRSVFPSKNRSDSPLSLDDIKTGALRKATAFKGFDRFSLCCELDASPLTFVADGTHKNEKIRVVEFASPEMEQVYAHHQGIVYMLTCVLDGEEYILKIGQTGKTMRERMQSYNCGTVNYRLAGTCSTTNFRILQSIATNAMDACFLLYVIDFSWDTRTYEWEGETSVEFASPMPRAVEDILVKQYIDQFGTLPPANIQADAATK